MACREFVQCGGRISAKPLNPGFIFPAFCFLVFVWLMLYQRISPFTLLPADLWRSQRAVHARRQVPAVSNY